MAQVEERQEKLADLAESALTEVRVWSASSSHSGEACSVPHPKKELSAEVHIGMAFQHS